MVKHILLSVLILILLVVSSFTLIKLSRDSLHVLFNSGFTMANLDQDSNRQGSMISVRKRKGLVVYKLLLSQVHVKNLRRLFEIPAVS